MPTTCARAILESMMFIRFIPLVLAATLLAGCAATPPATESATPSASASVDAGITSSSKVKTLDEALAFAATITPDMSSAKYEVVNTASKLRVLAADVLSPETLAEVDAQLGAIVTDATGSTTRDELDAQIVNLQATVATMKAAL